MLVNWANYRTSQSDEDSKICSTNDKRQSTNGKRNSFSIEDSSTNKVPYSHIMQFEQEQKVARKDVYLKIIIPTMQQMSGLQYNSIATPTEVKVD